MNFGTSLKSYKQQYYFLGLAAFYPCCRFNEKKSVLRSRIDNTAELRRKFSFQRFQCQPLINVLTFQEFLTEDITQPEWRLALDVQCAYPQEQRGKRLRLLTSDYFHSCASRKDRGDECLTHPPTVEVLADPSPEQSKDGWGFLGNNPLHYMIIGAVAVAFLCIVLILIYCTIRKYKTQRRHKGNKQLSEEKQSQLKIDGSGEEDHRTPLCEQYYSRGHRPSSGYESIASSQQSNLLTRESESSNNSSNTLPKVVSRRIRYDSGISEGQLSQSSRDSVLMERQHTGHSSPPLHKIEEQQTASDSVFVHSTSESQFQSRGPGAYAPRRDTFQQFYPITHSQSYSAPQQVPVVPHYHAPGYQQGNFFPNRASVMTAPSAPYPNNVAVWMFSMITWWQVNTAFYSETLQKLQRSIFCYVSQSG